MPSKKPLYYWDTSIWLAWLTNENRPNHEMDGVAGIMERIEKNEAILITSNITDVEMLEIEFSNNVIDTWAKVFQRRNIQKKQIDNRVSNLAQNIRIWKTKLKVPDAIHLATAIHYEVDQFHTFDKDDLLPLNGDVAGYPLVICKPQVIQYRLPGI